MIKEFDPSTKVERKSRATPRNENGTKIEFPKIICKKLQETHKKKIESDKKNKQCKLKKKSKKLEVREIEEAEKRK